MSNIVLGDQESNTKLTRAHFAFWQEAGRDADQAAELEAEWLAHGPHLLQALRDRGDTLAGAALTILEAQGRREESNG